eukprot:66924-Pelagomonas_calceolata.AAC.5
MHACLARLQHIAMGTLLVCSMMRASPAGRLLGCHTLLSSPPNTHTHIRTLLKQGAQGFPALLHTRV